MKLISSFVKGRMNKSVDERLLPEGEYVDAMNIRLGSTEESEIGAVENAKGNEALSTLVYQNVALSNEAICLGSIDDSENETIYWVVHDPNNTQSTTTNKVDMVVSYNSLTNALIYHVISTDDGGGVNTALNFSETYRVNGISIIENILLFTDNNNQPMRINVNRVYNEPSVADLLVIVKPPNESPVVTLLKVPGQENYMDTRFISFAYRYKYREGEYSAVSQFSEIAFDPKEFGLSADTYQNEGMVNEFNSTNVSFNTGNDKVIGIDLLFKLSNQSVISVIEKFIKQDQGWGDNQTQTINFTNRKIYTTLGSSEILRLFDNVPRKAQAQTIMGNRLMYGNYVDGYDIKDSDGNDCLINYNTSLQSEMVTPVDLPTTFNPFDFTIDPAITITVAKGQVDIDCASIVNDLVQGASLNFSIHITHDVFSGAGAPSTTQNPFVVNFSFILDQDYADISNMVISTAFIEALQGVTLPTNLSQCGTISQGFSTTDQFNCTIQSPLDPGITWNKDMSSVSATSGIPITAIAYNTTTIRITLIAMRYVDAAVPGVYLYEYFESTAAQGAFVKQGNIRSLHSDRDYEVGIVYMDEYNRSTTALVSRNNTVFVSPGESRSKNSIQITIPTTQKPPYWATRYKFVVKPSSIDYEVIYSNLFFIDPLDQATYILLEGDNQTKAAKGDRLRVKRDTSGPLGTRIETVILELKAQGRDFIEDNNDGSGNPLVEPAGLYMKVKPSGYNTQYDPSSFLGGASLTNDSDLLPGITPPSNLDNFMPTVNYSCYIINPTYDSLLPISSTNSPHLPWSITANSRVEFDIVFRRERRGNLCGQNIYRFEKEYVASEDYTSLLLFIDGESVNFNSGDDDGENTEGPNQNVYDPNAILTSSPILNTPSSGLSPPSAPAPILGTNQYGFVNGLSTSSESGKQWFQIRSGTRPCTGVPIVSPVEQSILSVNIRVFTSANLLIFETLPVESDSNIYYEGSDSYAITNGFHMGNNRDQTATDPAIVDSSFFNCFSFGNGAESYKIRDGLASPSFNLGERTTAVSEQDFKEAHRFADITYSGLYNADTNVNRLNEFNLGNINFKELEKSFGPIRVLSSRQTDILTLQEDKISYVLSSKNLLSDASGGGTLTSVPEVLGTVIARIEDFGISSNPESFVQWGFDKYFTDVKRGAVIQLSGTGREEQLIVISDSGMRSWFRDYFILTSNKQKLGGFDPYMNEYVLAGNLNSLPILPTIVECGTSYGVNTSDNVTAWTIDFSEVVGDVTVSWNLPRITIGETITINITYNGVVYTSGATSAVNGSFTFNKNLTGVTDAIVSVVLSGGSADFSVNASCPAPTTLSVIKVCINTKASAGKYIHNDFYWSQGTYNSPTSSDLILMGAQDNSPLTFSIAQYNQLSGPSGTGVIPAIPSIGTPVTIKIQSTKRNFDDFDFDPAIHQLKYALEVSLYPNTPAAINSLLLVATNLTPLQNPLTGVYYYEINYVQFTPFRPYLYLIYDYS